VFARTINFRFGSWAGIALARWACLLTPRFLTEMPQRASRQLSANALNRCRDIRCAEE
jgi:hypothetical protein